SRTQGSAAGSALKTPSFAVANCQHTVSGVLRRSNKVPAVTAVLFAQHAHLYRPSAKRQPPGF
ncbi:hypothetical protein, partial [Ferrimicrobium acidiphilum]